MRIINDSNLIWPPHVLARLVERDVLYPVKETRNICQICRTKVSKDRSCASRTKPGLHGKEGKVKGGIANGGKCKCGALWCKLQLQFDLHAHITKGEGFINKATHFCLDKDVRDSQLNFEIFGQHGDNNGFHFASVRCTHVKFLR